MGGGRLWWRRGKCLPTLWRTVEALDYPPHTHAHSPAVPRDSHCLPTPVASSIACLCCALPQVEFMHLDLSSLASVRAFTTAFKARGLPLHILVNNAGVFASRHELTADGFETMMGVHHVGHVLLTLDLLPVLEASAPARVVILTSRAHGMSKGAHAVGPLLMVTVPCACVHVLCVGLIP